MEQENACKFSYEIHIFVEIYLIVSHTPKRNAL